MFHDVLVYPKGAVFCVVLRGDHEFAQLHAQATHWLRFFRTQCPRGSLPCVMLVFCYSNPSDADEVTATMMQLWQQLRLDFGASVRLLDPTCVLDTSRIFDR